MNEPVMEYPRKAALITGAGRGIGSAIAIGLGGHHWNVVINYRRDEESARQTLMQVEARGGRGILAQADVSLKEDRQRLVETSLEAFGGIDLLVNNAGIAPRQRVDLLEMSETSYSEVMDTNLKGPFFLTQQVSRVMLAQIKTGKSGPPMIINIGSMSAVTSSPNRGEYCMSKAGMTMMTLLFADRLAGEGINVYEIRPGIIHTDMTAKVQEKYDRLIETGTTPIKRWGEPEDVALAVVAVAEGFLPYSTGEVINIDGGFHIPRL